MGLRGTFGRAVFARERAFIFIGRRVSRAGVCIGWRLGGFASCLGGRARLFI